MKKKFLRLLLCSLLLSEMSEAQTWNGSVSTNWNTPGNWTGGLPTAASNVTIPAALLVYPVLNSNVTINGITMNSGSRLDVNGFTLTLNGTSTFINFTGAILNNSNGATDIVINLNAGGGGYAHYFRSNTINDAIIFNLTGSDAFYEGDAAPANLFTGNATYNINGSLPVNISNVSPALYSGNLTVNRTIGGTTSMFGAGPTISGNFSFTNNVGGAIGIGNATNITNIAGTVNIACNYPSPASFDMYNIKNQTTGGTINIQNSQGMYLQKDTLKVAALNITGYRGSAFAYLFNNFITGNVTFADDATYSSGWATSFRNNLFTGTTSITINGTNTFNEAETAASGNRYIGNTTFNINSSALVYLSHVDTSQFDGNLTINRTVAGHTQAFNSGAVINGNFTYSNIAAGNTYFGSNTNRSAISGTLNITSNSAGTNVFEMHRLINQTSGGTINVQNSTGFFVEQDTIKAALVSITNYTGNAYANLFNNSITGNLVLTSRADYSSGYSTYIRNNIITGNSTFTNNGANTFYEADGAGNSNLFAGNTVFNYASLGTSVISHLSLSQFNGNLTVNRTVAGISYIFYNGGIVNGNFSYTNNTAGNTYLGNNASKTSISGTVNVAANYSTPNVFEMYRLVNQTTGGSVNVQNSGGFAVQRDTLKLTSFSITGYRGSAYAYLFSNDITANVTLADDVSYTGGYVTYLRSNVITGTSNFTTSGSNAFFDADGAGDGNKYTGNVTYTAAGGPMYLAHAAPLQCTGNVTVNRTAANTTYVFYAGSSITGNFSYTNNTAGNTYLGNLASKTSIGGTVNIAASYTTPNFFEMYRLVNLTGGGNIRVTNSAAFNVQADTLVVDSLKLTGYRGSQYAYFFNNKITGHLVTADDASYGGGYNTTFRQNTITGNTSITNNGTNFLYDADGAFEGSRYIGNVIYTRNGGTIIAAVSDTNEVSGNLVFNSTAGISMGLFKCNLGTNGVIEQLGTQPINLPLLIMEKTGAGKITLNDSVTITGTARFTSGHMYSSAANQLIFVDNATYIGASSISHVIGPVTKVGDDAFSFPVGNPLSYKLLGMSAPVGVTTRFSAEYKNQNPGSDGYNTSLKAGSFGAAAISKVGYWDVQRLTGNTNVTLTLGFNSNPYEQYPAALANLKVAHWNGAQWDDHGNAAPTGTPASGSINNSVPITSFSPFALAGVTSTYFYVYSNPGAGPDGTPVKFGGTGGYPAYSTKQLPAGSYSLDSIYLVPNGSSASFKMRDLYAVEKDDTTVTVAAAPATYISANGNGTVNFTGWRHFVYLKNGGNEIIGALRDNNLTLGNTTMTAYFSTANVATAPNGNIYLKRSFKVTSQFAPAGTKRVRFYILKTEYNNLVAADPASFPNGINSVTITKYTGPQEDALFNPIPGGNSIIIPNSDITIVDMGTMYSLDVDVTGFSGFYIGGNQANVSLCTGSTISVPSNVNGATYQWQVNTGSGFTNVSNGGVYGGAATKTLTLTNVPSSYYGYQYRAFINGSTYSQVYTVKFTATWEGTMNNVWENIANWSCGILPDANTDVLINAGKSNYPQLGANTSVRTVRVAAGTTVMVKTGFNLTITK